MNEQEWLECTDAKPMLDQLQHRSTERKLRLFAVACCRRIWALIKDHQCTEAIEISERYADGLLEKQLVLESFIKTVDYFTKNGNVIETDAPPEARTAFAVAQATHLACFTRIDTREAGQTAWSARSAWAASSGKSETEERSPQAVLLREIFGNPFRPIVINPAWLSWNEGTVRHIAQAIYDERAFDRLPILADALQDAGCDNADLLHHCRSEGPHVRGCWVVDLLLGKE